MAQASILGRPAIDPHGAGEFARDQTKVTADVN
jgi:hypothetical protein